MINVFYKSYRATLFDHLNTYAAYMHLIFTI